MEAGVRSARGRDGRSRRVGRRLALVDVHVLVAEAEAELPALERLERPAELLPAQASAIHHHVVRLAVLVPDEPAAEVVARDDPVGPAGPELQVLAADAPPDRSPRALDQGRRVRVVRAVLRIAA